jgi:hypothetical protein
MHDLKEWQLFGYRGSYVHFKNNDEGKGKGSIL